MKIVSIADRIDLLPAVVDWERREWGDDWAAVVSRSTARDVVPTIFLAIEQEEPMGCAMLIEHDMMTRLDLSPWIGGIFVLPRFRRSGVASALIRYAMDKARATGVRTWWLYTATERRLYEKFGWQYVEMEHYDGVPVTIMRYDFPV